jgi:hypothetical protein
MTIIIAKAREFDEENPERKYRLVGRNYYVLEKEAQEVLIKELGYISIAYRPLNNAYEMARANPNANIVVNEVTNREKIEEAFTLLVN